MLVSFVPLCSCLGLNQVVCVCVREEDTEEVFEGFVCVSGVDLFIRIGVFVCMLYIRLSVHGFSLCISIRFDFSVRLCLRLCCVCASVCACVFSIVVFLL